MIREKAVFCKLFNLNSSDIDIFAAFKPLVTSCPRCGANHSFNPRGSYMRYMFSFDNGKRIDKLVNINRVMCRSCKTTHARLPDILIPHSPYTLRFIIHVLRAYLNRKCSVRVLCEHYDISTSTLYAWKHRFRNHANLIMATFKQFSDLATDMLDIVSDIPALPSVFFSRYGFSFLQNRKLRAGGGGPG